MIGGENKPLQAGHDESVYYRYGATMTKETDADIGDMAELMSSKLLSSLPSRLTSCKDTEVHFGIGCDATARRQLYPISTDRNAGMCGSRYRNSLQVVSVELSCNSSSHRKAVESEWRDSGDIKRFWLKRSG